MRETGMRRAHGFDTVSSPFTRIKLRLRADEKARFLCRLSRTRYSHGYHVDGCRRQYVSWDIGAGFAVDS